MLPCELPTERAGLRAALDLQQKILEEGSPRANTLLKMQWLKANSQSSGQVIISDKQILDKVVQTWQFTSINSNHHWLQGPARHSLGKQSTEEFITLTALISSDKQEDRSFAINVIRKIRDKNKEETERKNHE